MKKGRKSLEVEIAWLMNEKNGLQDQVNVLKRDLQFQGEIIDSLSGIIGEIDEYFTSGNEIPVSRATINRKDWLTILQKHGNIV